MRSREQGAREKKKGDFVFGPLHVQKSIRMHLSLAALFIFKGLNNLFTELSAICIPKGVCGGGERERKRDGGMEEEEEGKKKRLSKFCSASELVFLACSC